MSKDVFHHISDRGSEFVDLFRASNHADLRGSHKRVLDPDLNLKVGEQAWGVNRCVVRLYSQLIDGMLRKNTEAQPRDIPVDPKYVRPEALDQILDLIYDGKVTIHTGEILNIYAASNVLKYAELADVCLYLLREHVDFSQLTEAWKYASQSKHGAFEVRDVCRSKIVQCFELWSKTDDFCKLTCLELTDALDTSELREQVERENVVFEAIIRWLHFDWTDRYPYIHEMLAKVQWKLLNFGNAAEFELVRDIFEKKMHSLKEKKARNLLMRAIGYGPCGDFDELFGLQASASKTISAALTDSHRSRQLVHDRPEPNLADSSGQEIYCISRNSFKTWFASSFDVEECTWKKKKGINLESLSCRNSTIVALFSFGTNVPYILQAETGLRSAGLSHCDQFVTVHQMNYNRSMISYNLILPDDFDISNINAAGGGNGIVCLISVDDSQELKKWWCIGLIFKLQIFPVLCI